ALEEGAPDDTAVDQAVAEAFRAAHAVVWVIDIIDFTGTAHPSLLAPWAEILKRAGNLWVAVNKVDLLPPHVPHAEVVAWVGHRLAAMGWNPKHILPVSAETGRGTAELWDRLRAEALRIAVAGATNTGKSTLLH